MATRLWGGSAIPAEITERLYGKGRIVWGGSLTPAPEQSSPPQAGPKTDYPDYSATAALLRQLERACQF